MQFLPILSVAVLLAGLTAMDFGDEDSGQEGQPTLLTATTEDGASSFLAPIHWASPASGSYDPDNPPDPMDFIHENGTPFTADHRGGNSGNKSTYKEAGPPVRIYEHRTWGDKKSQFASVSPPPPKPPTPVSE